MEKCPPYLPLRFYAENVASSFNDPWQTSDHTAIDEHMRPAVIVVPLLSFALGSCSIVVNLAIVNRTDNAVLLDTHKFSQNLLPKREEIFEEWPDNGTIEVKTDRCTRTFNLDENFLPGNEWHYSTFKIIRRFAIYGDGLLRIVSPDKAHSSTIPTVAAERPPRLALTPLTEHCSS